jgi:hypothetical protein
LGALGSRAQSVADTVARFPRQGKIPDPRYASYVPRLLDDFAAGLR